uniref:Uncharacterized protein n=1 Tax=Alexandrium monilatum TaxID=311494 RepID=A0A7S4UWP9_9DINO|mmetsp:Transcript_16419/g.52534  ORF Transcript_16419/g.52534 Transcript_16419/m.52534 type:complete len:164 (-) Transcript_16419:108-599(-)
MAAGSSSDPGTLPPAADTYFEGAPGVLAVFDFDAEQIAEYRRRRQRVLRTLCPLSALGSCCPWSSGRGVERDSVEHLALTKEGIFYVKVPTKGSKVEVKVPYDQISMCYLKRPPGRGHCLFCVEETLWRNIILSSEGILVLKGLKHPQALQQALIDTASGRSA